MSVPKVSVTKDYRLFLRSPDNRPTDAGKHRRLRDSFQKYGFLSAFPIVCRRNSDKRLVVVDGQHRLMFAESFQVPVYYIVTEDDFSTSEVNSTALVWTVYDHAKHFAEKGVDEYLELLEFHELYALPIGTAAAMLAGVQSYARYVANSFVTGDFKIKDREWAHRVATLYTNLVRLNKVVRSNPMLQACMAVCRVKNFDQKRLLQNSERCRDKLVSYSTRDAYLEVLEEIYNYGRKQLISLKIDAIMAMRDRSAAA